MEQFTGDQRENISTAASLNGFAIEELREQLKTRRKLQKNYGINLVLRTELPLAECARIVGVHRMTLHRWVQEHNAGVRGNNEG